MEILTLLAILASPAIAVRVSLWVQQRKEKRDAKLSILRTLLSSRHSRVTDETVRALNLIDAVFYNSPSVRKLWREYFEMVTNQGLDNQQGWAQRDKKYLELITQMAKVLGYGREITHLDVDRVYYPVGLEDQARRNRELSDELLRVLKGSQGLQVAPRPESTPPLVAAGGTPQLEPPDDDTPGSK